MAAARNVISGNTGNGVAVSWGLGTAVVEGNDIGTNAAGTAALGNGGYGIDSTTTCTIGGSVAGAGNVISGNHQGGIWVTFTGISIEGNLIGTNAAGTAALGNGEWGILLQTSGITIGGTTASTRNIISGNASGGIDDRFGRNLIEGNDIGTNEAGTAALGNAGDGVQVGGQDTIGGTASGARNVVSGNAGNGVEVDSVSGNLITGNDIGTNVAGTAAVPNTADGILVDGGADTIGGMTASDRNVISSNGANGIEIINTNGTVVEGNRIGTNAAGTAALGNAGDGVLIDANPYSSNNNTIGGTTSGAGNTIAYNGGDGVAVSAGTGNAIRRNQIYADGGLAIDLTNRGNNAQPAPTIRSAVYNAATLKTTITGTLTATANTVFYIELFASPNLGTGGTGQGQRYLTTVKVTTDASGHASFSVVVGGVATGQHIAATATDPGNDTSEFGKGLQVS